MAPADRRPVRCLHVFPSFEVGGSQMRTARLIDGMRAAGLPSKVVVGGPPFSAIPDLWRAVGADAGTRDVRTMADEVELLLR